MKTTYIPYVQAIKIVRGFNHALGTLKDAKDFVDDNCRKVYSHNDFDGNALVSQAEVIEALMPVIVEWSAKTHDAHATATNRFIRANPKTTLKILMDNATDTPIA